MGGLVGRLLAHTHLLVMWPREGWPVLSWSWVGRVGCLVIGR